VRRTEMEIKRLVDQVDRGPRDDLFFPSSATQTIFRREFPPLSHAVPDVVEVGYKGAAQWGGRITIPLSRYGYGDLLQWICLRIQPRSWLGTDLESKILSGAWTYAQPENAWMWADSLGSIAIEKVELEIGSTLIETWRGDWMDVWSRTWMEGGRAAVWDSDIYGRRRVYTMRNCPDWMTVKPTEDGYVYCWLPLSFLRRPGIGFPLVALGEKTEMRIHITLSPFADVVRRRSIPRTSSTEVPLGTVVTFNDVTGGTPIPYDVRLPSAVPAFDDITVLAGVVHMEEPMRLSYMHNPQEILYDRVQQMVFDLPEKATLTNQTYSMQLPLRDFNGPLREICWFVRRKRVWDYNEWTNYGLLLEDDLVATIPGGALAATYPLQQEPMVNKATLRVDNAIWRQEAEQWWRYEYGLAHRGGIRLAGGMVYGFVLGDAANWTAGDEQPAGTVNASRCLLRLDLDITVPSDTTFSECSHDSPFGWEVHVFAVSINWMRFVNGVVGPLFAD
jgi:hypothetical protein